MQIYVLHTHFDVMLRMNSTYAFSDTAYVKVWVWSRHCGKEDMR